MPKEIETTVTLGPEAGLNPASYRLAVRQQVIEEVFDYVAAVRPLTERQGKGYGTPQLGLQPFIGVLEPELSDRGPGQTPYSLPVHEKVEIRRDSWPGHLPAVSDILDSRPLAGLNGQLEIEGGEESEEGVQLSAGISLFDLGNGVLLHSNGVTDSFLRKALVLPFGSQSLTEVFGGTDFLDHCGT